MPPGKASICCPGHTTWNSSGFLLDPKDYLISIHYSSFGVPSTLSFFLLYPKFYARILFLHILYCCYSIESGQFQCCTYIDFAYRFVLRLVALPDSEPQALWILTMANSSLGLNPTVISHNAKGAEYPRKAHNSLKRTQKRGKPWFVFLQETHFKTSRAKLDSYFTEAYYATNNTAKSKGVYILVSKHASFEITDKLLDPSWKGNVLAYPSLKLMCTFNTSHFTFCQDMLSQLKGFSTGCVIQGGDFYIPLNPLVDTTSGKSYITYKILKKNLNPIKFYAIDRLKEFPTSSGQRWYFPLFLITAIQE